MQQFQCPVTGKTFIFSLLPLSSLHVDIYQRPVSSTLVKELVKSMDVGFTSPLLVVAGGDGTYGIIDGQHRYTALTMSCTDFAAEIPCIILPPEFRNYPLIYNIEKNDDIKAKCEKLYRLYNDFHETLPDTTEEAISHSFFYQPHLITCAFAFKDHGVTAVSIIETAVKKLDLELFTTPLTESLPIRKEMGAVAAALNAMVEGICTTYRISDFNLKKSIVSKSCTEAFGARKKVDPDYFGNMQKLMDTISGSNWSWMTGR